jgi:hypothetical protein
LTTNQKIDRDGDLSRTAVAESSVEEARDRLAGLLPDDALQDALKGWSRTRSRARAGWCRSSPAV